MNGLTEHCRGAAGGQKASKPAQRKLTGKLAGQTDVQAVFVAINQHHMVAKVAGGLED